jgi:hypothetical protein
MERASSRIIGPQESLPLYKSFILSALLQRYGRYTGSAWHAATANTGHVVFQLPVLNRGWYRWY